jgi:uncharacterized protein (TIGR03435 family)
MMRGFASISFVALLSSAVFGQSTETTPTFDVADVHVRARTTNPNPFPSGGVLRSGRYDMRNATMLDLIRTAYGVADTETILGGPNWLERDRFDVIAKAPQTTSPQTVRLMLQALLADRFKLVLHKDTKPAPGYALTIGKGKPKLKEATGQGAGCQGQPQTPTPGTVPYNMVSCRNLTMEALAQNLRGMAGGYLTNPVVDMTGLKGSWDFDLKWTTRALLPQAGNDGISIFDAVDQQLGLKLELQKVPTPVLVVDSVNQKPTDNPPGLAQSLPPPPLAEFDVAEIKLSPPDTPQNIRLQPGGRLDAQGVTMKMMITLAWDINDDELLAGAPKWLDSNRYSLTAKASTAVSGPGNAVQVDIDDIRQMLRALLIERFKIASHTEDRPVTAYTLVVDKPKLTKADPANRTGWKEGPAPDAKDQRNATLARMVTARNMTMAQFAEDLQRMASGYIHVPVTDATGLDGAYDFTLTFTPIGLLTGGPGGRGGDPAAQAGGGATAPAASDPTGGLSLFDAVNKQLGLKLEKQKRTMPVLVIDRIEEKPTDN